MAPRLFPQFRKLPPELRVRIWRSLMLPRIIRGKWQSRRFCNMNVSIYILYAGPVPVTLCVDSESRSESQKHYSLVRCLLPLRPLPSEERDGEKLGPAPRQKYLFEVASIWVNCNIDTRGGGPWGGWLLRSHVKMMFDKFWEGKPKVKGCEKWVAWREMNPQWKEPEVKMVSISKAQRETLKSKMEKEAALAKTLGAEKDEEVTPIRKAVNSRKATAPRKAVTRRKCSGISNVPITKKVATSGKAVARKNRATPVKVAARKMVEPARRKS
ncbi:hypothetical protein BUE80_DR004000 [Diplocarpon rosae]|nr:hypothetical protein BUE80_DR004000 [Diplocarpon rosae]